MITGPISRQAGRYADLQGLSETKKRRSHPRRRCELGSLRPRSGSIALSARAWAIQGTGFEPCARPTFQWKTMLRDADIDNTQAPGRQVGRQMAKQISHKQAGHSRNRRRAG